MYVDILLHTINMCIILDNFYIIGDSYKKYIIEIKGTYKGCEVLRYLQLKK